MDTHLPITRMCYATGCLVEIPTNHVFCKAHWDALPGFMRDELCKQHSRVNRLEAPDARQKYRDALFAAVDHLWIQDEPKLTEQEEAIV